MSSIIINDIQLNRFFDLCSFSGLKALYAIKLSFDKKIAFDRNDFTKEAFIQSGDYFYGFIVACSAVELFSYNKKNEVITITSIDPLLSSKIESAAKKRATKTLSWADEISKIEKYFS